MVLQYSDIQTHFDTNWNTVTVAKPTFYNGNVLRVKAGTSGVYIRISNQIQTDMASCTLNAFISKTPFEVECVHETAATLILITNEVYRLITTKTITAGWWHPVGWYPIYHDTIRTHLIQAREVRFATISGGL